MGLIVATAVLVRSCSTDAAPGLDTLVMEDSILGDNRAQTEGPECGETPQWATAVGDAGEGGEEEADECYICTLNAQESGEELIVPCLCISMPVHRTCLENWRMSCNNPAGAISCPNCRQRYNLRGAGADVEGGSGEDPDTGTPRKFCAL